MGLDSGAELPLGPGDDEAVGLADGLALGLVEGLADGEGAGEGVVVGLGLLEVVARGCSGAFTVAGGTT